MSRCPEIRRGVVGLLVALGLALVALPAVGASPAGALTTIPGQIYGLADVGGARGDLFRNTTSNTWRRLTSGLASPESVAGAPNGKFAVICATRGSGGIYRIYRVGARGGALRNLVGNRQACGETVSPDSKKVAYITDPRRRTAKLNIVRAGGGGTRTIYSYCSGCLYNPVWAGKRIYFERAVRRSLSADREVYSVRARDGKGLRRHTNDSGTTLDYRLADVSRDGRRLLIFVTDSFGSTGLSVYSPAGVNRFDLALATGTQSFADASLSPSGASVAFLRSESAFDPTILWTGAAAPGVWYSAFPSPAPSTTGLYSIDWVRR